ncbi:MAG: isoleucine--tRNA ligase [Verrucomicrobia bacterium]|nr:isoleucine--tRNA ligase [Verrucomicrobiota bacterium]
MNYKDTLNLPRTAFPMKANLAQREPEILRVWNETRLYQQIQKARQDAELFVLHDGPPFANGDVHMGTALNKILKDMVVKSQSMLGKRAPYVPGWDCHGLPIEYKVVKESGALSPVEVRKRCAAFARKFVEIQREQFKRLGALGDWEHPYLTMNPAYEAEILRAFAVFVEKGLVYQSKKPVFWSTGAQTALAEAEVEYQERDDTAVFVRFPLASGKFAGKASVAIWTTTPWTLPANLAIAVHPNEIYVVQEFCRVAQGSGLPSGEGNRDDCATLILAKKLVDAFCLAAGYQPAGQPLETLRGSELEGLLAQHPFLPRTSTILNAEFVTMDTGTGAVHIAPGHGEDDYALGSRHGLPILSPVNDHGRYTADAGIPELAGKYVFEANADIVRILRDAGMLLAEQTFHHSYPYCWRSKTPIIFRAVDQFFIRIDALRGAALEAITKVNWIPAWGENRIAGTVASRPDWVISRQRSWGVPLPVFYSAAGEPVLNSKWIRRLAAAVEKRGSNIWFELSDRELARELDIPEGTTKRNDTLDVWIDSGVSHCAVCATHPELRDPADMYLEATDQHRGWFQSSLMTSVALNGRAPYKTCVTHGFVVDVDGRKISKSSTYAKPMDAAYFVNKHGADLVRLWVSSIDFTDDVPFSEEMFTRLGEAYRRIRNTLRILHGNLFDFETESAETRNESGEQESTKISPEMTLIDRWILARLAQVIEECRGAYEKLEFHRVYQSINQFCTVDLSSLYIDITKDRMYCDAPHSARRRASQYAMHRTYSALCRLLAPILAFTAEEAWQYSGGNASVHLQYFPDDISPDALALEQMRDAIDIRAVASRALEEARQQKIIGNSLEARLVLELAPAQHHWNDRAHELAEILIVSDLVLIGGAETKAAVAHTNFAKCARCWRHREAVGKSTAHPDLCDRCEKVISGLARHTEQSETCSIETAETR